MRVLLDENILVQLKTLLGNHLVQSVNDPVLGWKNIKNGKLLSAMAGKFDVLITADQNIYHQHSLAGRPIAIIAIASNRRQEVQALAGIIRTQVESLEQGCYCFISRSGEVSITRF